MQPRFDGAYEAIDAANARDPHRIVVDGVERPKELVHADVVERWVRRLDPGAGELQILAARAHHLRRWIVPRSDYPAGRAGYLRWRSDQRQRQAAEVAAIVRTSGYADVDADRVAAIVAKVGLGTDPVVQVHEDALCLAFLELQLDDLADQMGPDRAIEMVVKTLQKMGARGLAAVSEVPLSTAGAAVLARAMERA